MPAAGLSHVGWESVDCRLAGSGIYGALGFSGQGFRVQAVGSGSR